MNRLLTAIALTLLISLSMSAQGKSGGRPKDGGNSDKILIAVKNDNLTSELLPIPLEHGMKLTWAEFGAMYFGPGSGSDVSFILLLKGTKGWYGSAGRLGVKVFVDDAPLLDASLREVDSVKDYEGGELVHFFMKETEIAKMAAGKSLSMTLYDTDAGVERDTLRFDSKALAHFRRFATSIELLKTNLK